MIKLYHQTAIMLWLCLLSFAAWAQEGPDTLSYRAQNDYLLAPLDKSQIPSGILYERVFPLSGLPAFTGTAAADTSHPEHFYQAFYELQQAGYAQGNLPAVQQLKQTIQRGYTATRQPIALLYYHYHRLDTTAVADGLIQNIGGQAHDVPNRPRSPYLPATAVVAAPLSYYGLAQPGPVTFVFDTAFYFTNTGKVPLRYEVNFGQGPVTLFPGGSLTVTFPDSTVQQMHLTAYFSDSTSIQAVSAFRVATIAPPPAYVSAAGRCAQQHTLNITGLPWAAIGYAGISQVAASGTGTATIFFSDASCADKKVRKPIIFLDGYDPNNTRDAYKIYDKYVLVLI